MNHEELNSKDHEIIFLKSLGWLCLAALGFILALAGAFYTWIIVAFLVVGGFFLTKYSLKKQLFSGFSKELVIVGIGIFIIISFFAFFTTPTIFSGRDQGAIADAAIRLAQNHKLEFSTPASDAFFKIYGPGKALNFPGFYYNQTGELSTQFPLVYIAWLAIFYVFFGLAGLVLANVFLLFAFMFSFYALARTYLTRTYSMIALTFALTSFSFIWFAKFTLSENMALALLWTMIFSVIKFLEKQNSITYFTILLSGSLLVFTRIEGVAFFAMALLILFLNKQTRQNLTKNYLESILLPLAFFFAIFVANFLKDIPFYKEMFKAFLNAIPSQTEEVGTTNPNSAVPVLYTTQLFFLYGMMSFLILGFFGTANLFIKKHFRSLIAFIIILPSLVYLIDSQISIDQPWTLRRYIFSILPSAILYTTILIATIRHDLEEKQSVFKKILPLTIIVIAIALNLPSFIKFATYSENKGLLEQTQELGNNFSSKDLILIDRTVSGDGWTMLSEPLNFLYGKNAVYFFNTNDLEKLDLSKFENVYLIVPENHKALYTSGELSERLIPFKKYSIKTDRLDTSIKKSSLLVSFPKKTKKNINGEIYLLKK